MIPLIMLALAAQDLDPAIVARSPDAAQLATIHELLASEPHVAGTPGDARTIERIAAEFRKMGEGIAGWDVEVQEFFPLLTRPVKAKLEIVGLEPSAVSGGVSSRGVSSRGVLSLGVTEPNLAIDPQTAHPDLDIAWNAWSGSGIAEAGVVYVNYGRREDFAQLKELGVDPRGKIALARYGGNFRGYKAKFAEEAGCVGLVIFTDPGDSGTGKGKTWPDAGSGAQPQPQPQAQSLPQQTWANAECVQRGSLITTSYIGDPLTPNSFASKDAKRLNIDSVALPKIPVQPIGYGAAQQIFMRMKGTIAPAQWKGGMSCDYPLEGGALRLRMEVEQTRAIARTANVIARLRGATRADEQVVVGSHHDAWCFGAADPLAGTICTLESARNFCDLARAGKRPDRTLVFATWGAEEFGIFGSSEFVENDTPGLAAKTVAYINLDMAAMGLKPGAAVSPTLRASVTRAIAAAPGPHGAGSALDVWPKIRVDAKSDGVETDGVKTDGASADEPSYGDLGGGSDHVAFWCHAGIPSISLSAGGSEGTSYHSNYDTVAWYRATVGHDYAAAQLVTGITNAILAELADARSEHISCDALVTDCIRQAEALAKLAAERKLPSAPFVALVRVFGYCRQFTTAADERMAKSPTADELKRLHRLTTMWVSDAGLPNRPWFRNLYAATDRYSGYATEAWPLAREAVEDADPADPGVQQALFRALAPYYLLARELKQELWVLSDRRPPAK
ncbi:MAG: hypothetical protein RLY72_1701 [Planctomycetota bacterium]